MDEADKEAAEAGAIAPALRFAHISKSFGGVRALKDVSLEVLPGEVHCLAGENGSGKSTLIKIITGVYTPDPGAEMDYFGKRVEFGDAGHRPRLRHRRHLAGPRAVSADDRRREHRLQRHPRHAPATGPAAGDAGEGRSGCSPVSASTLDLDAPLNTLSIAERQIVAICRTLVGDARLIFMDEPTASLTHSETDSLLAIVREALRRRRVGGLRQPPAGRGAEDLVARHRAPRRPQGRGLRHRRHDPVPPDRADDRQDLRQRRHQPRPLRRAAGPRGRRPRPARASTRTSTSPSTPARSSGLTGLIGAGRTELGLSLFGMTRPDRGSDPPQRQADRLPLEPRRHRRRHRLCLGGPADARPRPAAVDRRQHRASGARQDRQRPRPHLDPQEGRPRRPLDPGAGGQDRQARGRGLDAVGRQPAAHRAGEVARHRAEAADPRFAHRRRRCRRARRALRHRAEPRRSRASRSSSSPTRCRRSISTPTASSTWPAAASSAPTIRARWRSATSRRRSMRRLLNSTEGRLAIVLFAGLRDPLARQRPVPDARQLLQPPRRKRGQPDLRRRPRRRADRRRHRHLLRRRRLGRAVPRRLRARRGGRRQLGLRVPVRELRSASCSARSTPRSSTTSASSRSW